MDLSPALGPRFCLSGLAREPWQYRLPSRDTDETIATSGRSKRGLILAPTKIQNVSELAMSFFRPFPAAVFAVLAFSTVPASPSPMSAPKPSFDGSWSVLIVTEKGKCDRAYRYPVKIE